MTLSLGRSSFIVLLGAVGCGLAWACSSPAPQKSTTGQPGTLAGACYPNNTCNESLSCVAGYCLPVGIASGGGSGVQAGSLGGSCLPNNTCTGTLSCVAGYCLPTTTGTGGGSGLTEGALGGSCYANNTCDADLMCLSGYCIPTVGTGGTGAGGAGQGGSTAHGGSAQGGAAHGGSAQGGAAHAGAAQGGSAQGGSAQGGSSGASTLIVSMDGWIADGSNSVGIVGPWFMFGDDASGPNSTFSPLPGGTDFTGAGDQICVSGTVSQSDTFGPTLAFAFNEPEKAAMPYVPSAHGVTGFSFGLSGTVPPALQVSYKVSDSEEYCRLIRPPSANSNTVRFSSTTQDCWTSGGTTPSATASFTEMHFQLPVNYFSDGQAFNFCITNLKAITN